MTGWTGLVDRYRVTADPLRTQRRIELLVVLLTLFLFLQLGYGAFRLAVFSPPEPVLPAADSLQVKTPLKMATVTPEQSGEIRNRPLFWPERRPTEVVAIEAAAMEVTAQELKDIELRGVFGSGDSVGIIALVKNQSRRIRLGEEVDGWKLESVGTNEAVFTAESRQARLSLLPQPIEPAGKANKRRERKQ